MSNFALHEVLRNLNVHRRFILVCLDEGVWGLGEGSWVPNLCPPVPASSIHRSAWKGNSANFACRSFSKVCPIISRTAHVFAPIRALDYLPCSNS